MNLSSPFISRPIATTLLSIGLALAGILAFNLLPTAALPEVEYPVILVQASLPGASPENMSSSVTTPLEGALSSISAVTNITSNSTSGNSQIIMQFDLSRDINGAARDVQAAIDASAGYMPSSMTSAPTYRKVNPADSPIIVLSLSSDSYAIEDIYDVASTILQQKILKVEGVGQVMVVGGSLPAVRVSLDLDKMNQYKISLIDVNNIIAKNNINIAKGAINGDSYTYEIALNDQIFTAQEYGALIVSEENGNIVRLSDIAEVKRSEQNIYNKGFLNGKPSVFIVVYKSPGANVVDTNLRVREAFSAMKNDVPSAMKMGIVLDRTATISASLRQVEEALVGAMIFVIIVVYLFLGNFRSVIVPGVAMALTLLGTFAIMWFLGFSLNILSLMAMAIATGFVVDDAIVVLENVSRHIEEGIKPKDAALKGAAEIGFTVMSISISLIAVFIPILLMGDIVGRLFREFAVTLAVSILVSLVVSLTLTPMMCAFILRSEVKKESALMARIKNFYEITLAWALEHNKIMLGVLLSVFILTVYLFIISPKGFFPQQDTGRVIGVVVADQNISFTQLGKKLQDYVDIIDNDPAVENVAGFVSGNVNTATIFIALKDLQDRKISAWDVIDRLRKKTSVIPGSSFYMQVGQDLVIGGRNGNAQYQYTISGSNIEEVNQYAPLIMREIEKIPGIIDLNSDQQSNGLQSFVKIDYDKAAILGVAIKDLDTTLYTAFGQNPLSIMYHNLNQYYVISDVASGYVKDPDILKKIYIKSASGVMVPLSSFAKIVNSSTILAVNHQSLFPSATLSFNLEPGANLGEVINSVNKALSKMILPITLQASFRGTAQALQDSLSSEVILIIASILAVYLILGMLYESLIHPLTIISTLPSAGVGALLALLITKTDLTIVAIIGVILLVGIVQKNAIMMIDFVLEIRKKEQISPRDAIYQAALMRFRPILMTTMSALLGAVPMAIGSGMGSEMYKPLGIAIIGGLIVSQLLTLYTTPIVYLAFEKMSKKA